KDSSYLVRREVALQLAQYHSPAAAGVLRQLVADSNPEVQMTSLEAIETWPNDLAVPLLLQALRDSSFKTRQLGLLQLERRRGSTVLFPLDANREERSNAAAKLALGWKLPSDTSTRLQPL